MSNKYKFEIVGVEGEHTVVWNLRSRLGQLWIGSFKVIGCTEGGDVHLDINVRSPKNTTIPRRGLSLVEWNIRRHVINAVHCAVKHPEILFKQCVATAN